MSKSITQRGFISATVVILPPKKQVSIILYKPVKLNHKIINMDLKQLSFHLATRDVSMK